MMLNATFNNISIISWRSYFFLICGGNPSTRRKPSTCRKSLTNFYHIMLYWIHLTWAGFEFTISGVISTEYIGICKSNYHTSTTTTASFVISINNLLIIYLPFMIYLFIALYLNTHTHTRMHVSCGQTLKTICY